MRQGELFVRVTPLVGVESASDFYDYYNDESHTGLERSDVSIVFLYLDPEGKLSLFVIHDIPADGTGGAVDLSFEGLPSQAVLTLIDDPADTYTFTPPTAQVSWQWFPDRNDGLVIGNLEGVEFTITITPDFIEGIVGWELLTGELPNPERISLNLEEPVVITGVVNIPPQADFTFSPLTPGIDEKVTFDGGISVDPDGRIVKYEWDFDGDGIYEVITDLPVVEHAFTISGDMLVTLRVTDDDGAVDTITKTVTVLPAPPAAATALRRISTTSALPGSTFRVVVEIKILTELHGLGLDEDLPPGWEIEPIESAGAVFKRAETQWVFARRFKPDEVIHIIYEVTIPTSEEMAIGPLPAAFCINGAIDSASPAFRAEVEGERCLEVTACLPILVAIAHLVLGETEIVDLRISEEVTAQQLERAVEYWLEDEAVPQTCGALIDLKTLKQLSAYKLTATPIDKPLPEFNETAIAKRIILTPLPFHQLFLKDVHGNRFIVKVEIEAIGDLNGLGLQEHFPQRWTIRPLANAGATFKEVAREWIFTEKIAAGEVRTISYEVTVPRDEACALFRISGYINSFLPKFEVMVEGDEEVEIVCCLAMPVAVAHWDVEHDRVDVTLDNRITFDQIQRAIAFWLEDDIVPSSCEGVISYDLMKLLIAHWLTDTPVDQPLPPYARWEL
jgi:PKD repeat protein